MSTLHDLYPKMHLTEDTTDLDVHRRWYNFAFLAILPSPC